jgi:hypothetical protein
MPSRRQPDDEREYREEATRLALLDKQTQRDLVAMYAHKASNRKLSQAEREAAGRRAQALARLLGLAEPGQ